MTFDYKAYRKEYDKKRRWTFKMDALHAYGCACAICNITNPQYLTIDHIDGDGGKHRKRVMGDARQGGWNFYRWLKKENYPPGFQVLCWNHNASKHNHPEMCKEPYVFSK